MVDIATSSHLASERHQHGATTDGEGPHHEKFRGLVLTAAVKPSPAILRGRHQLPGGFQARLDERVIEHDVEGMEHHISPSTCEAIEALTAQLKRWPACSRG